MKKEGKKLYNISFGTILSMSLIITSLNLIWADNLDYSAKFASDNIISDDNASASILTTGDEDTSDYKEIKTIADLYAINNDLKGKYILMNDIDMSSTDGGDYDMDCDGDGESDGWMPIGVPKGEPFSGILDGNGHRLKNISIRGWNRGLFSSIDGGTIRNLGFENINVITGSSTVGSIAGKISHGVIERCYVTGNMQRTQEGDTVGINMGGIVGYNESSCTIQDCYTNVTISSKSDKFGDLGGIAGYNSGQVKRCYSTKPITYTAESNCNMIANSNSECFFLTVTGETRKDKCAQGLSSGLMKAESSFTGFDFENVWYIDPHAPNTNYPQLKSCPQDRITSVEIEKTPDKLEYLTTDEDIDLTGGTIKITYEDGTVVAGVSMEEAYVFYDFLPAGKQTVTVEYCGKTATFEITVKKKTPTIEGELEYEKKVDDVFKLNLKTDSDGAFEFKYEPEEGSEKIIRLSDGSIECLKAGEAIVEVSLPETDTFEAASEEIKITINEQGNSGNNDDDDDEEDDKDGVKRYKITFDSNGGSSVPNQKVEEGDYIDEPSAPTKEGFVFDGWFTEKEFNNKWIFSSNLVYSKVTLYAKWVTYMQKVKEDSTIINGDVVLYNGVRYYLSGTKINGTELFTNTGSVFSSDNSIAKVNKKGVITFKKDGKTTITADTGESMDIIVFGKKPVSASVRVGDVYAIPDEIMIETLGDLRYSNASKVTVSDDGKLTALASGTVKVKYTQSGKTKVVLKLKIKK